MCLRNMSINTLHKGDDDDDNDDDDDDDDNNNNNNGVISVVSLFCFGQFVLMMQLVVFCLLSQVGVLGI